MMGFRKTEVFPVFTVIGCFIDPNTGIGGAAAVDFPGSHPDGPGLPVYRDITDKQHLEIIHDGGETLSVVFSMPESAGSISYIKLGRVGGIGIDIYYPATHDAGTDIPEGDIVQQGT